MIAGTVRVGDSAFDGVTGLTEVTAPYTLQSIGSYAFYNSSVKRYVFEAVEAPVLEATYVSPESVAGNAELYRLFGTASVQQVGSRIFYANFYDYVAKVVEEKDLTGDGLYTLIEGMLADPEALRQMGQRAAASAITDANERIYRCICQVREQTGAGKR